MSDSYAFGETGGAGRVHDQGKVVGAWEHGGDGLLAALQ